MRHKQTLIFNKFTLHQGTSFDEAIGKLLHHQYSDELGIGITSVIFDEDIVTFTILVKTPSTIQRYNDEQKILENVTIFIFEEIKFIWDPEDNLIYSMDSATKFTKAKQFIKNCLTPNFSFGNVEFLSINLVEKIRDTDYDVFISDLHIKKFKYSDDAYGRFCVHIDSSNAGMELYDLYSNNLSKITLQLNSKKDDYMPDFNVSISPRNSITIECDENDFDSILNFIKKKL